jgi:hypothetical protein
MVFAFRPTNDLRERLGVAQAKADGALQISEVLEIVASWLDDAAEETRAEADKDWRRWVQTNSLLAKEDHHKHSMQAPALSDLARNIRWREQQRTSSRS